MLHICGYPPSQLSTISIKSPYPTLDASLVADPIADLDVPYGIGVFP